MTLEEIRGYLKAVARRPNEPTQGAVREALAQFKRTAIAAGSQEEAKRLWCMEQSLAVQEHYLQAFRHLHAGEFYEAWCEFERTEIEVAALERHEQASWQDFRLDFIQTYTSKWQALFPYKMFYSPELLHIEKQCSVCKRPVLPRSFCGHRVGEIYDGELCYRTITKLEMLGISLVDAPEQKYSVLFLTDEKTGKRRDHYRYDLVQYAIKALREPFDGWDVERSSRRQPHSRFSDVGRNDPCPCDSGMKYKQCCLPEAGVLQPHFEFTFAVPPSDGVLRNVFIR